MNPGTQALPLRSFSTVFKVTLLTYHQHFQVREGRCVHVCVCAFAFVCVPPTNSF